MDNVFSHTDEGSENCHRFPSIVSCSDPSSLRKHKQIWFFRLADWPMAAIVDQQKFVKEQTIITQPQSIPLMIAHKS
jgi:hypothetical protein